MNQKELVRELDLFESRLRWFLDTNSFGYKVTHKGQIVFVRGFVSEKGHGSFLLEASNPNHSPKEVQRIVDLHLPFDHDFRHLEIKFKKPPLKDILKNRVRFSINVTPRRE
ncbi:hypothetical protein HUU53_04280 [Candidatus Micrarchaeota archaeon]|nr:hypothetical protein [Candidatus Micrarchaeota archaeon]